MLDTIFKDTVANLLGKLSVFYGSTSLINTMQEQILAIKDNPETSHLYSKYQNDLDKIKEENKKLEEEINELLSKKEEIAKLTNLTNFTLSIDYLSSLGDEATIGSELITKVPNILSLLDNHITNIQTLNTAIAGLATEYELNFSVMTIEKKIIIGGVIVIILIAFYMIIKKHFKDVK